MVKSNSVVSSLMAAISPGKKDAGKRAQKVETDIKELEDYAKNKFHGDATNIGTVLNALANDTGFAQKFLKLIESTEKQIEALKKMEDQIKTWPQGILFPGIVDAVGLKDQVVLPPRAPNAGTVSYTCTWFRSDSTNERKYKEDGSSVIRSDDFSIRDVLYDTTDGEYEDEKDITRVEIKPTTPDRSAPLSTKRDYFYPRTKDTSVMKTLFDHFAGMNYVDRKYSPLEYTSVFKLGEDFIRYGKVAHGVVGIDGARHVLQQGTMNSCGPTSFVMAFLDAGVKEQEMQELLGWVLYETKKKKPEKLIAIARSYEKKIKTKIEYIYEVKKKGWDLDKGAQKKVDYMKKADYKTVLIARAGHVLLVDKFDFEGVWIRDPYQGIAAKLPFVEFMRIDWEPILKFLKK